jgi:hypothetical protein
MAGLNVRSFMRMRLPVHVVVFLMAFYTAFAAEVSDYLIKSYQSRHQKFEWHFQFSRVLATPEWDIEKASVPLDPGKAWQIAKKWMKKHGCENPQLISIEISPFIREAEIEDLDPRLSKRFYYSIRCVPAIFDTMMVYVLLDGSVLEPLQEPHKGEW